MAMTFQQAYPIALRLRAQRPDLQDMDFSDLVAQIRSEGMGASGAGVEGLADLFATQLTAASPAPLQAARLVAPKPTAQIVPGANMARPDPRVPVGRTGQTLVASGLGRDLSDFEKEQIAGIKTAGAPQPDARSSAVAAAAPVREASPVAAAMAAAEAPAKPKFTSRLRPQYEAAQAELEQLTAQRDALTAQGQPVDANTTYGIQIKSGVVSKLKAMVDAEEAAVVDAESAAVLERQTNRLTREEELVKQARKRAPGDALIAFGGALAGAKAGEKFASVLTRGLMAGNESYTNARNAGEESSRTIEEKRDALIMKNRELIEKARADAINLANSGAAMTKAEMEFANLTQEGVDNLAMAPFKLSEAKSKASKAETEALFAPKILQSGLDVDQAQISNYREVSGSGGSGTGDKPLTSAQAFNRGNAARIKLEKLEKRIIEADGKKDYANTEQLLNQYRADRDAYNRNAAGAGLSPITVRGFPVKLKNYEAYVAKNKRHPSGKTTKDYDLSEALNKYGV